MSKIDTKRSKRVNRIKSKHSKRTPLAPRSTPNKSGFIRNPDSPNAVPR